MIFYEFCSRLFPMRFTCFAILLMRLFFSLSLSVCSSRSVQFLCFYYVQFVLYTIVWLRTNLQHFIFIYYISSLLFDRITFRMENNESIYAFWNVIYRNSCVLFIQVFGELHSTSFERRGRKSVVALSVLLFLSGYFHNSWKSNHSFGWITVLEPP